MTRYALFLRGVNVGGVNLKMADVAETLTAAGFSAVRTLLASGNVLVDSSAKAAAVRATAESTLRERFGYEAWVLVYDVAKLRDIVAAFPFEAEVPGLHSYVTFIADDAAWTDLSVLAENSEETIAVGDGVIYWQIPKGDTLSSIVGKTMGNKRHKSTTTTRNLRTLSKVLHAADPR
ncbi:pyridoxamine 5-phosphate oxidase [Mycolicibacter minnesotensis]|uniref:Pyridoxamine 5-phosphate oxidase n=1 Tax=Mycolicibacter minnesotensis TaxID=1118379 RepID=A0A7I7R7T4_9MYCO|nr:DUF1697 domain-containing protein [Mycolicibacter minnesotensis]ORA98895.1 pyridoxamine 5-phosphate oxidase [Mycolicibacter minnesotensis]BBY34705.1 pyridoxamine 5'-phosphate oxidase [Mycolicibacter minnesotensis]